MAPKRKEVGSPAKRAGSPAKKANSPSKKAKQDPEQRKLKEQLRQVAVAIGRADISSELEKMIEVVLPLTLGEFSDQRHRFQEQVISSVDGILAEAFAGLQKDVAEKKALRDAAAAEKPQRDSEASEATSKLEAKVAEVHRLKVTLAEKATVFRGARTALAEAEEAKVADGQKVKEAEKKKSDYFAAMEHLKVLKENSSEEGDAKKNNHDLMVLLKKYKFEESMMIALPAALAKTPDARGQFDLMAITQLDGEIEKLIAEQDAILAAAAPGQAKCEAAITEAEAQLAAARGEQRVAAKAFDVAFQEQDGCEKTSAAAQKAVRDNTNLSKKLERSLNNAEVEVELFEQGPLEAFKALRQRATPPPVVEAEEEMAVPQEPVVEENMGAAEVPLVAAAA